jgi:hypothetical protein
MLDCIDRQQRNKLKLDNLSLPSPERHRPLRHQFSSDNMHVPPFNIPNLRIDQRKTSSAEDMARKNSTGSISELKMKKNSNLIPRAKLNLQNDRKTLIKDPECWAVGGLADRVHPIAITCEWRTLHFPIVDSPITR